MNISKSYIRLLLVCVAYFLSSCSINDTPALRAGGNIWPGYEPMQLAKQLGYYDAERVKVITFPSAVEVMRAYRNNAIELAALTADEALNIVASEPDLHSIILVADYSNGADAIVAHREFATLRDLRGKRIGVELNALGAFILTRALVNNEMTLADVQLVPLTLDQHEAVFAEDQVDAVVTFEPRRTHLLAQGAHQVFSSAEIPREVMDVIVVRKTALRSHPEQVHEFVEGWLRALATMNRQPDVAAKLAAARYRITEEQFAQMLSGIRLVGAKENRQLLAGELRAPLQALSEIMLQHSLLKRLPNLDTVFDARFVNDARIAIDAGQ